MSDHAGELAADFAALGPFGTCDRLGLKFRREGRTAWICCPWHAEHTPSCTVAIGPAGTIRVHCFACSKTWDALALVAQLRGLDTRADFRAVLLEAADALGRHDILDALEGRTTEPRARPLPPRPAPEPEPKKTYPDREQVLDLIAACTMTARDAEVTQMLADRGLGASDIDIRGLAYALPQTAPLPRWAWGPGGSWIATGHRAIVPVVDPLGVVRSVRASRIRPGDGPKRLAAAGHTCAGLVMADAMALEWLRAGEWPSWAPGPPQIVIAEGEPDFWTWATRTPIGRTPAHAVLGVFAGSWCDALAVRFPDGAKVAVWTDHDAAGDGYAQAIADTLAGRCSVIRGEA